MTAQISPQIKKQYFDDAGAPLSGGKLYVYEAGTTTLVTTYTSEVADTPNTNPIILDSRGEVGGLFLAVDTYKFVLKDSSDVTIWTQDSVTVRDVGAEIDGLTTTINTINNSISTDSSDNRLVSGKQSADSSQSRFLLPIGTASQVKVLASSVNLKYVIAGTQYSLVSDLVGSGLVSPPITNNTALVNDSNLSGQNFSKILGEFGTVIPYDTAGSEITSRDGEIHAFKKGTEYFVALIDNTNSCLRNASRGFYFDLNGNPIERASLTDNDIITLMKRSFLYLKSDNSMLVSYTEPIYSTTQPTSPLDGDMWFDITNKKWMRFSSTVFVDSESVYIGECIQDENGNTVGARSKEFYGDFTDKNTFEFEYVDSTSVKSKERSNSISVYGTKLEFLDGPSIFSIASDIETGEIEAASTYYWPYFKEDGDKVLSPHAPLDRRGDMSGFYHPYETWRYAGGRVLNNSSSNFDSSSVLNSPERERGNLEIQAKTGNYSVVPSDDVVLCDATSGAITVTLPRAASVLKEKIVIKKTDSSINLVTINTSNSEEIDGNTSRKLATQFEIIELFSDGTDFHVTYRNSSTPLSSSGSITIGAVTTAPTKGTVVRDDMSWSRDGQFMDIFFKYEQSSGGSSGNGNYLLSIPGGYTVDTSYISASTNGIEQRVGSIQISNTTDGISPNARIGSIGMYDSTKFVMGTYLGTSDDTALVSNTNFTLSTATITFSGHLRATLFQS